jgi:hypothetical protein
MEIVQRAFPGFFIAGPVMRRAADWADYDVVVRPKLFFTGYAGDSRIFPHECHTSSGWILPPKTPLARGGAGAGSLIGYYNVLAPKAQ